MRITLIEDNISLAKGVAYQLQDIGHSVDVLHDGEAADVFLKREGGDLVILDINLPGKTGLDILQNLRARGDVRPVILLTARGETEDRVKGLDAGADDYLVKPFDMAELLARIRAIGRRNQAPLQSHLPVGPLSLDIGALQLHDADSVLPLPRREIVLLSELVKANGRSVTKAYLLDQLYGAGSETNEEVIEVYVSRLRKRLRPYGIKIEARRGLGYCVVTP